MKQTKNLLIAITGVVLGIAATEVSTLKPVQAAVLDFNFTYRIFSYPDISGPPIIKTLSGSYSVDADAFATAASVQPDAKPNTSIPVLSVNGEQVSGGSGSLYFSQAGFGPFDLTLSTINFYVPNVNDRLGIYPSSGSSFDCDRVTCGVSFRDPESGGANYFQTPAVPEPDSSVGSISGVSIIGINWLLQKRRQRNRLL
ncbi:MAG: hypothetical protein JO235_00655 [Chroococcidiopsidaceae cyanobacterium CP_BM_RX_35]|nr:hypothetical protein [Chroococcidiopsidaceae cyanobacterium CP_BM_RX_35]